MITLPNWWYSLICNLIDEDDARPKLYRQTPDGEWVEWEWRPADALRFVPADVVAGARAIAEYRRSKAGIDGTSQGAPVDTASEPGS